MAHVAKHCLLYEEVLAAHGITVPATLPTRANIVTPWRRCSTAEIVFHACSSEQAWRFHAQR
jgi:hypothetical protein